MSADRSIARRLFGLARPYRGWMLLAGAVASITVLASVGLMAMAGWFIAAMAIAGATTGMMNYFLPAAGIRFFAILRTGGRYGERLLSHEATFRLLAGLRLWLFRRLEPLSPGQLEDRRGADLATGLQADIDTLQHAYLRLGAPVAVAAACSVVIVTILLLLHAPTAIAVAALLVSAGWTIPAITRRAAAAPGAAAVAERAALRTAVVDFLQGATDLRVAGAVERNLTTVTARSDALVAAQRRTATLGALAEAAVGLSAGLALWAAAFLATASVSAGHLAPPLVPALALAALASFEAVSALPGAMQRWGEVKAASTRIFALADRQPAIVAGPDPSPELRDASLVFDGVVARYARGLPPALTGFSLAIPAGHRVAIVGPSGVGKSTIPRLLLRFLEYEAGTIRLGGHDLRAYRPDDLRRLVGVAGQEAHLFNATIRENLLMAAPGADDAAMLRALAVARLGDFVASLPDGLDTFVGEAGTSLSAGQARRLVVARTLLRQPHVLVLDEPTENLDATTARALLAAIADATRGRTVLLITHDHAAAAAFADEIVRLAPGESCEAPTTVALNPPTRDGRNDGDGQA